MTTDTTAVRAALVELLTTGQHHHAATPTTLSAIGATRTALSDRHHTADPAARCAQPPRRLAALTTALGATAAALSPDPWRLPPDTAALHAGLCELAAVALGWLDTLPTPPPPPEPNHNPDDGDDEPPF